MIPTLTVDVGTTSLKIGWFDADGRPRAQSRQATVVISSPAGSHYDPDAMLRGVLSFLDTLNPADRARLLRIAITGVGGSGGLVRSDLSLASPIISWQDQRGAPFLQSLTAAETAEIYSVTGLPASASYGLPKLAWAVAQVGNDRGDAQWLSIAEYLAARMTGARRSEFSLASRTMALDLRNRSWAPQMTALAGAGLDVLPELHSAQEGCPISQDFAAAAGLSPTAQVHIAGHDHMVGAEAAHLSPGELLNSTGTTEGLLVHTDEPALGESSARRQLSNGIACNPDRFTLFASIPTGGAAFATLRQLLNLSAPQLSAQLADLHTAYLADQIDLHAIPVVMPQFRGSPPPSKSSTATGVLAGVRSDTTTESVIFGCFLGLALQFRDVLGLFPTSPDRIKVIGPASRNPLWLQLKADVLGTSLSVASAHEVVSRGAQALACGATGTWESCDPYEVEPRASGQAQVTEWWEHTSPLWEQLRGISLGSGAEPPTLGMGGSS
ncbi:MAG: FGGY-family carbohydrate kinase [Propioniciclava sp.]